MFLHLFILTKKLLMEKFRSPFSLLLELFIPLYLTTTLILLQFFFVGFFEKTFNPTKLIDENSDKFQLFPEQSIPKLALNRRLMISETYPYMFSKNTTNFLNALKEDGPNGLKFINSAELPLPMLFYEPKYTSESSKYAFYDQEAPFLEFMSCLDVSQTEFGALGGPTLTIVNKTFPLLEPSNDFFALLTESIGMTEIFKDKDPFADNSLKTELIPLLDAIQRGIGEFFFSFLFKIIKSQKTNSSS